MNATLTATAVLTAGLCASCPTVGPATCDTFLAVNGTNMVLCLPHAVSHEARYPEATFMQVSVRAAAFLTA